MPKVTVDPQKLFDLLKKDIQELTNEKARHTKQIIALQKEENELAEKVENIKKTLKVKEDALVAKHKKKEEELDRELAETRGEKALVSAKRGELEEAIKQNKQAESKHNKEADIARASNDKAQSAIEKLESIAKTIKQGLASI